MRAGREPFSGPTRSVRPCAAGCGVVAAELTNTGRGSVARPGVCWGFCVVREHSLPVWGTAPVGTRQHWCAEDSALPAVVHAGRDRTGPVGEGTWPRPPVPRLTGWSGWASAPSSSCRGPIRGEGSGCWHVGSPLIRPLRTVSCPGLLCVAAPPDHSSPRALLGRVGSCPLPAPTPLTGCCLSLDACPVAPHPTPPFAAPCPSAFARAVPSACVVLLLISWETQSPAGFHSVPRPPPPRVLCFTPHLMGTSQECPSAFGRIVSGDTVLQKSLLFGDFRGNASRFPQKARYDQQNEISSPTALQGGGGSRALDGGELVPEEIAGLEIGREQRGAAGDGRVRSVSAP